MPPLPRLSSGILRQTGSSRPAAKQLSSGSSDHRHRHHHITSMNAYIVTETDRYEMNSGIVSVHTNINVALNSMRLYALNQGGYTRIAYNDNTRVAWECDEMVIMIETHLVI
jgi:hypothetical protein